MSAALRCRSTCGKGPTLQTPSRAHCNEWSKHLATKYCDTNPKTAGTVFLSLSPVSLQPSTALCCSTPVAIEDRNHFQSLTCTCLALKKKGGGWGLGGGRRLQHQALVKPGRKWRKCYPGTAILLLLLLLILNASVNSRAAYIFSC